MFRVLVACVLCVQVQAVVTKDKPSSFRLDPNEGGAAKQIGDV